VAVRENVMRQIAIDTRPDRPNLVLFDVQPDQLAALEAFVDERGATLVEQAPLVSARIASFAVAYHVLTFAPITLIGLWYLRKLGLGWRELEHVEEDERVEDPGRPG